MEDVKQLVPDGLRRKISKSTPDDLVDTCTSLLEHLLPSHMQFSEEMYCVVETDLLQVLQELGNPEMGHRRKNADAATQRKTKGNQHFSAGYYAKALASYSESTMKSKVPALKAANMHPKRRFKKDKDLVDEVSLYSRIVNSGRSVESSVEMTANSGNTAKEHKKQLERLEEKDPEFYQFLKEHDKELLEFNDEDTDDDAETCPDGIESLSELTDDDTEANFDEKAYNVRKVKVDAAHTKIITSEMVDVWCKGIKKNEKLGSIRSLLRAFRTACHHGDDGENEFSIVSSSVFNKIMLFVLNEMDGILRGLLHYPNYGGKKESVIELTTTSIWNKYGSLMRLYLGNALHVLNQMTDEQMIAFTLKRIKDSAVFLVAFPVLLRKYIKVVLHFWGTGGTALQVVSFLFLRDLCVRLGSDCLDTCLKGIYKAYVMVCKIKGKYASVSKLQHLHFLGNCVTELYGVDLPNAYQHAFICIRQLATVLRNALSEKPKGNKEDGKGGKKEQRGRKKSEEANSKNKKEAYLKVYDWQFINCLELWTNIICNYSSDANFQHLSYPLTQIIFGVARLVPIARYLPIRMQCARMLNRIGSSSGTFIPVSMLLLDVLDMKELANPPTGGVGKAVDFLTRKLVGRPTLKTRAFQDACIFSIVDLLAEHLAQWSYSVAFFELSFITLVRLRNFCKTTKIDLFRKEIKELIRQVEANTDFINTRRSCLEFSLGDHLRTASFLQGEKESRSSPLSQFSDNLKLKARQRSDSLNKTSLLVGTKSSKYSDKLSESEEDDNSENEESDEGKTVFSSSWLPNPMAGLAKSKCLKEQQRKEQQNDSLTDEDVVEDLVLSSDDDEPVSSSSSSEDEQNVPVKSKPGGNSKRKSFSLPEKTKRSHTEVENTKHKHSSGSKKTPRPAVKKFKKA